MQVKALDHVNIITHDIDATAGFYERLLGLRRGESPGNKMGFKGAWLFDAADHPIVHLSWKDPAGGMGDGHEPGAGTGSFHHVAFQCEGYDDALRRVQESGAEYRENDLSRFGMKQIFVRDPNNVGLELNFRIA